MKRSLPPKNYAFIKERPPLLPKVNEVLSNNFKMQEQNNTDYKCYFIRHAECYYMGDWKEAQREALPYPLPNGLGTAIYKDGSYYYGQFVDGEANDKEGLLILPNGAYYNGQIIESKINGRGTMREKIGEGEYFYTGQWMNGRPHGEGQERYDDGGSYIGTFVEGTKHCYDEHSDLEEKAKNSKLKIATYISGGPEPETYKGEFKDGLMHGYGQYQCPSRNISYKGAFRHGKKEGRGSYTTEKGTLTGQFRDDMVNGSGKFEWSDGRWYEGEFKNSLFDGMGRVHLQNGNILEGMWRQGHGEQLYSVKQ